jgi:hypothetical protein
MLFGDKAAVMAHTMPPLSTAQSTTSILKVAPKSPALKNSSNLSLGAKCDTRRSEKYIQFVFSSERVRFFPLFLQLRCIAVTGHSYAA